VPIVDTVSLDSIISALPFGLAVVDNGRRIVLMNAAFHASLGLDPDRFSPGAKVEEVVQAAAQLSANGLSDPEAEALATLATDRSRQGRRLRRRTCAGRSFDIFNTPMPNGGFMLSSVEITAPLAAEAAADAVADQTGTAPWIGLAIFDAQGALALSNPSFAELLGLPPKFLPPGLPFTRMLSLLAARDAFDGVHWADFAAVGAGRAKRLATVRHRDSRRFIDMMFEPLPTGGWTIAVSDTTSLINARAEGQHRARLLDAVLLAVPNGVCVYGPDRRVAMLNQTYLDVMAGAPRDVGDQLNEIVRGRAALGDNGGDAPDQASVQRTGFEMRRPQARRRTRANGTAIDVRTASLPDGGHISVVTDITAQVRAEAESRQRIGEMDVMLDSIRHGIMRWNADNRLITANLMASQMFDFPRDWLSAGRTEAEVVEAILSKGHLGTGACARAEADAILTRDRSAPDEREIRTVSGRVLVVQSNPVPAGGWVSTIVDITKAQASEAELRQAKQVAEAANQAKSRFLATMSHELRTPLNAIVGFSDALSRDTARCTAEDVAEYGEQINAAGKQLLALINTILDVARLETGRFEPGEEAVDVANLLRRAVRQAESAAQAAELTLVLDVREDLPRLRADERRLLHVLSQLLSNAIKFTDAGGSVTVEAGSASNGDLWLRVVDTGIGIAEAELERVFEPFTQLDDSLARRYGGTGLGLYTARAIVTAQGGRMRLTSQLGSGTTVEIVMPGNRLVH
jgi:signal transduction histidine kinase